MTSTALNPKVSTPPAWAGAEAGNAALTADRRSDRLVVTGTGRSWVLIVDLDPKTGKLTPDENWKMKDARGSGIDFDRPVWPHGPSGKANVHGALFGPASR